MAKPNAGSFLTWEQPIRGISQTKAAHTGGRRFPHWGFGSPTYFIDGGIRYDQDCLDLVERSLHKPFVASRLTGGVSPLATVFDRDIVRQPCSLRLRSPVSDAGA